MPEPQWSGRNPSAHSGSGDTGTAAAITLVSSTTLASDGTFDVAGISQAYNDLRIVCIARGTDAGQTDTLRLRFNNDSAAARYHSQSASGNGLSGTGTSSTTGATSAIAATFIAAAGAAAGIFTWTDFTIAGYANTVWQKDLAGLSLLAIDDGTTGAIMSAFGAHWFSTAAITRIQVFGGTTANLLAGSQLRIYGVL